MKPGILGNLIIAGLVCTVVNRACADDMSSDDMSTNPPPADMIVTPADFVWDAAIINLEEIHLGQVAQTNTQNKAVQKFGKRMIRDHSRLNAWLTKIAEKQQLPLPATNTFDLFVSPPEHEKPATKLMTGTPQERLMAQQLAAEQLESLTGPEFDEAYADAMVKGHENAIAKYEAAVGSLDKGPLKKYAKAGLTTVRHHFEMAQKLQGKVMNETNAPAGGTM